LHRPGPERRSYDNVAFDATGGGAGGGGIVVFARELAVTGTVSANGLQGPDRLVVIPSSTSAVLVAVGRWRSILLVADTVAVNENVTAVGGRGGYGSFPPIAGRS
jgi:hypothetical protein